MYPFRMYGRTVEINRFSVTYPAPFPPSETEPGQVTEYTPTREEADAIAERTNGTVSALDTSNYDWLDGIEVADVPDTMGAAIKIYEMGRAAYEALKPAATLESLEKENSLLKAKIAMQDEKQTLMEECLLEIGEIVYA